MGQSSYSSIEVMTNVGAHALHPSHLENCHPSPNLIQRTRYVASNGVSPTIIREELNSVFGCFDSVDCVDLFTVC